MRILMLMPDSRVRGPIARIGAQLVAAMTARGARVVVSPWGRHADDERLFASVVGRALDVWRIRGMLRRSKYDVFFIHTAHDRRAIMRDIPLMVITRGLARRRIVLFHGSLSNELSLPGRVLMKAASRWVVRNADVVLVLSSEEVREWQAFEPRGDFRLVANSYAHNAALEPRREDELDKTRNAALVVLFVGRLLPTKGIYNLVEAVAKVREQVDCQLFLAGDGGDREALLRLIRERGLEGHVRLLGYLQGAQLARAYRTADVFALPTSHCEGFPTVLTEAMDAGLPIVTTRIRGAVDHLANGQNALFVLPGRVDLLASALHRLLTDVALRHQMAVANRAKVRDFAPSVVAGDYLQLLDTVLNDPHERLRA